MATQYSNKPIVTDGLVYALDFGNPKSYVSGSTTAQSLVYNPVPATFSTLLPGDIAPPAAAYSVRKVVSSYTGSAMMVQSASVSQSIGFDANGNLDTGSIATFAGSGDAFVKIWYDQSGNGYHVSQTTAANQPTIVTGSVVVSEGGVPALSFDGTNDNLSNSTNLSLPQPNTVIAVAQRGDLTNQRVILDDLLDIDRNVLQSTTGKYGMFAGGVLVESVGTLNTNQNSYFSLFNGANSNLYVNTSLKLNGNVGSQTLGSINIGAFKGNLNLWSGSIQEVIVYNSDQSSNRTLIESNINSYYQIYSPIPNPTPGFDTDRIDLTTDFGIQTGQSFPGFSYSEASNATVIFTGETQADSTLFSQDGITSIISTTSSVGFGSPDNTFGRNYPVSDGLNHIAFRFSSGSVDCFVNGVPVTASLALPTGSAIDTAAFTVSQYSGSLGNLQIYNRPLTGNEIYNNFLIQARRYNLPLTQKSSLDENANLFLESAGITDPIITSSIDTFVRGLKSNNLWDKMIAIYPFVGTGSDGVNLTGSQLWNLKEPSLVTYPLSFTGSWIGSTSGSAPSGSNTNISTQVAPSTYYPFYNTQSAHISILSYDTPVSSSYLMGTGMTEDLAVSTLAGDYGTPAAAYSVRKVRTAYSGALMDVRRSYDNVTASIGYVSNGDLDTGSLLDWTIPGRNNLPGEYSGLAAAYSLRKVSASYDGYAVKVRGDIENQTRDIGFDASGDLDTGSLLNFTATGSNVLAGSYSGLAAAYSLRKVVPGYAGDAIEVQSGSVSQSIGFDSIGNLDTGSLLTFVGSGDGFIKTWYDQSENNNHATASSDTQQPKIVSAGSIILQGGKPAMLFDGSDDRMDMANLHGQSVLDTYFVTSTSDTIYLYPNVGTGGNYGFVANLNETATNLTQVYGSPSLYANGTLFTGTRRVDVYNFLSGSKVVVHQGASTSGWSMYSFSGYQYGYQFNGYLQELIAYTSSQAANRTYIENNINAYYDIYTTSSVSTENAFVSTWYDQSGNNRHATQTATGSQPLIVSSGSLIRDLGNYPSILFESVREANLDASSAAIPQDSNFAIVSLTDSITTTKYAYRGTGPSCALYLYPTLFGSTTSRFNYTLPELAGGSFDVTSSASLRVLNTAYRSGTTFGITRNGNLNTTTQTVSRVMNTFHIGSSGSVEQFNGRFTELLIYHSDQSANRPLIENNINNYYQIYTGSNHGFVERWYDQSGNNRHAVQTLTGSQPIIVESGSVVLDNNRSALNFDGNDFLPFNGSALANTKYSIFAAHSRNPGGYILGGNGGTNANLHVGPINTIYRLAQYANDLSGPIPAFTTPILEQFSLFNGNSGKAIYYNSSLIASNSDTVNLVSYNGSAIGQYFSNLYKGKISEIVMYSLDQTSNREPIEYNINDYYNIYPQTSSFITSSFTIKADPTSISGSINNKLTSGIASSGPLGLITVSRTGSNSLTLARNGAVTSFVVPASGALSTGIYLGAINNNGIALGNSPLGISFASVGTGLTGAESGVLSDLISNLDLNLKNTPSEITEGLLVKLDGRLRSSYPGTGNTWFDTSGNSKNATLVNNVTFDPANFGSLDINNSGDHFTFSGGNAINIQSGTSVTFNIWVNLPEYVDYGNPGFWRTGDNFMIFSSTSGRPWVRWNNGNILQPGTGYSVPLNEWVNLTYVVESGGPGVYFYVNGELKHSNTHNRVTPSFNITQLGYQQDGLQYIPGKYGSVSFYNRALTQAEITQNFNATRGRFGI